MAGAASTMKKSSPFTGMCSCSTTVGVLVRSFFKKVSGDDNVIHLRLRDHFVDFWRRAEKKVESSKHNVMALTSMQTDSTSSSTLWQGSQNSLGTVKQWTSAETDGKDANMDGTSDSGQNMVFIGPHLAKAFSSRLKSCTLVTVSFSFFIVNYASHLRAASISYR